MSLADPLLDFVFQWFDGAIVQQAAGEVARECRAALWHDVQRRIRGMSLAQSRGYIRAVAPDFVVAEVDAVLARRRAEPRTPPLVVAQAIEAVIDLLADDIRYAAPASDRVAAAA